MRPLLTLLGMALFAMQPQQRPVTLTIENHSWADVNVYAVRGSMRVRLGMVGAMGRLTVRVPASGIDQTRLTLLVDPIGSTDSYTSDAVTVHEGSRVSLDVGSHLPASFVTVGL